MREIPDAVMRLADEVKTLKKQLGGGKHSAATPVTKNSSPPQSNDETSLAYIEVRDIMRKTAALLTTPLHAVAERVQAMLTEVVSLREQAQHADSSTAIDLDQLIADIEMVGTRPTIIKQLPHGNANLFRQWIDQIRKKTHPVAVFFAVAEGEDKVLLAAGLSRDLVEQGLSAGDWIRAVAPIVGGGGGGKPDLAQAGGKEPGKIAEALAAARNFLRQ
jgi:alanyl-tRNA synthetase